MIGPLYVHICHTYSENSENLIFGFLCTTVFPVLSHLGMGHSFVQPQIHTENGENYSNALSFIQQLLCCSIFVFSLENCKHTFV